MTDPRVGEIEARLAAATPGPWFLDADGDSGVYTEARASNSSSEIASAFRREDEAFIAAAPADVAYLLAELRKAHEALARVDAIATDLDEMASLRSGSPDTRSNVANRLRAAVAAANGSDHD